VTRDGHEIPLRNVWIQAVATAEASVASRAGDAGAMTGAGGGAGMSRGGDFLGRTTGAVGGTVGSGLGAPGGLGSLAGDGTLRAGPGATAGLDADCPGSTGVFGLRGLSLSGGAAGTAMGAVMTSSGKSVHLDQGTLPSEFPGGRRPGRRIAALGHRQSDPKQPSGDRR
jgi:hypothetical protein